ncbi:MAG: FecR domain-containing protein [Elusimicrobia bacterium]|nr:FecR domain-containing protein [Elusimicrobiota bacterium]
MKYIISLLIVLFLSSSLSATYVFNLKGWVEYKKEGASEWERISSSSRMILKEGDELRTKRASTVQIYMDDGTKVQLAPQSSFKLRTENKEEVSIGIFFGRVRSWVKKFSKKFEVRTPSAVCAVRGTDFIVSADSNGNSKVEVYSGSVMTGDSSGKTVLVKQGEMVEVSVGQGLQNVEGNPNSPASMDSAVGDAKLLAKKELYNEISKESVMKAAQAELQSAEYKERKVAIDAFGNRVRMEEYIIRPQTDQFKYVVLNSRDERFDFGKMIFTFNKDLPADLSLATENMISASGSIAPEWYLTDMNSIMSNTQDKVAEDASGGHMVEASSQWSLVFNEYSFYAAGPDEAALNGGLGKWIWTKNDYNVATGAIGSATWIGSPTDPVNTTSGDVYHNTMKNTFNEGTWIQAEDFVLFDDGKIASSEDFSFGLGETMDSVTDKLNFERVYTSSLFGGRKIDMVYSVKLLKNVGLLSFE